MFERQMTENWQKTHPHSYLFVESGPLRKHFFKNMTEMCHIFHEVTFMLSNRM